MKILDCTIRDGGYYTNWDFEKSTLDTYIYSLNNLPIDYIEIGYRSTFKSDYYGEYFYSPTYVLKEIKEKSDKKIAIMLNEKDIASKDLDFLLKEIIGLVDMIRIAVDPKNLKRALTLAIEIKRYGFEVGFNIMYMSLWKKNPDFLEDLSLVNGKIDYLYMVDSYGSTYPNEVIDIIKIIKKKTNIPLGFHGHNNLELGLINTLTALDHGVEIVDATITGMGRGAGNLKTELLLSVLDSKGLLEIDYNPLSKVVDVFLELQKQYNWGTNLPYMVSGSNNSPQKQVMDLVIKRAYSFNSIIRFLQNQLKGLKDNQEKLPSFKKNIQTAKKVLIIGGGPLVIEHSIAIQKYLNNNPDIVVVHASSKNAMAFNEVNNRQVFCLVGNEGYRMENIFLDGNTPINACCVLPPYPRKMGTYIPVNLNKKTYELDSTIITEKFKDSHTSIALHTTFELEPSSIEIIGYDGYSNKSINKNQQELVVENNYLFKKFQEFTNQEIYSLTHTEYSVLKSKSIYSLI